jgi:hypothetical protein
MDRFYLIGGVILVLIVIQLAVRAWLKSVEKKRSPRRRHFGRYR